MAYKVYNSPQKIDAKWFFLQKSWIFEIAVPHDIHISCFIFQSSSQEDVFHLKVTLCTKTSFWGKMALITDKETDESWDIFIIWKINSGLVWAAGQYCEKKVWGRLWATFKARFFMFSWAKNGLKILLKILKRSY